MKTKQYKIKTLIDDIALSTTNSDDELAYYCNHKLGIRNVEYIETRKKGICFNYALDNNLLKNCFEAISYLETEYKQINLSQAENGDIITYFDNYGITHFAKIYETNNTLKGTIIRSKWGDLGIFETDLYSVPKIYGNFIKIWRKEIGLDK